MLSRVFRSVRPAGLTVLLILAILVLAACAKPPEPTAIPTKAPAATAEPTAVPEEAKEEFEGELTMAIWDQIDADPNHSVYSYHEILQQWNDLHPNVDLQYEYIGGGSVLENFTWIKTHLNAGTLPDVVMIYFPSDDFSDPDLVYDFTEDMKKPNPYSDNPTWRDDFPFDGILLKEYAGLNGEYFFVGPTLSGDSGVTAFVYNKDIFDEVGVTVPETWAEFLEIQQKIKDAGYTPFFQPIAGPMGWLIGWPLYTIGDQLLDEMIKEIDFDEPKDNISIKEATWAVKTDLWRADDPRFLDTWRLIKEWSQYWQEGFLAPPPEGDPFVQGTAAIQHTMNLWIGSIAANPEITFEWGTFYQPPVTKESSEHVTSVFSRRVGNTGAPAGGSMFLMIPLTTVETGKLDMARDLVQYTTAPEQLQYWCEHQPIPCYEPGTPIEEVFPDQPDKWVQLRGFFEPGAFKSGTRGYSFAKFGHDASTLSNKILQEYLGDAITLEEAAVELQALLEEEADKAIREHPDWDTSDW